MKLLSNKKYLELFSYVEMAGVQERKIKKLKEEIDELNHSLSVKKRINMKLWSMVSDLTPRAEKWDAELERQRIKNKKYRDAKKAEKIYKEQSTKEFAKANLGKEIKTECGVGKICGYSRNMITIGFDNFNGWKEKANIDYDFYLIEYKSYWRVNFEEVKQQLNNK